MELVEGLLDRGSYKIHFWVGGKVNAATIDLAFLNEQVSKGSQWN